MKNYLLSVLICFSLPSWAQSTIVTQDFSSSSVVGNYVSQNPDAGQFETMNATGAQLLPPPDNENRLAGEIGSGSAAIVSGKLTMHVKSSWCIYRASGNFFSLNTTGSSGTIQRNLGDGTAFMTQFDFAKSRDNGQYVTARYSRLSIGPFEIDLAPGGTIFSVGQHSFAGEHRISFICNSGESAVSFLLSGSKTAEAGTAYLYVDDVLVNSAPANIAGILSLSVSSDSYAFTSEPYYAPGNPKMIDYTVTFDNFLIQNISPYTSTYGPTVYGYILGTLYATNTMDGRYVYTREVDSPTNPGQKETVKIYFDGTQWVWELIPSDPGGRTTATILATNASQSAPSAPCSGWTNGFGLQGGGCNTVLPVTLTEFKAVKEEGMATLLWSTTFETNSDYFAVEHSLNAKNWNEIGKVSATGESNGLINYHYTHIDPLSGQNYYRLRQTDNDGTFAFSRIASVNFSDKKSKPLLYPNPVSDRLYLNNSAKAVEVGIYNLSGQTVLEFSGDGSDGISLQNIGSGIYVVKIRDQDGLGRTAQIVVQK